MSKNTKKVPCHYEKCKHRRIHFEHPEVERGIQLIEVPDDFAGQAFCSLTCKMMHDGCEKVTGPLGKSGIIPAENLEERMKRYGS